MPLPVPEIKTLALARNKNPCPCPYPCPCLCPRPHPINHLLRRSIIFVAHSVAPKAQTVGNDSIIKKALEGRHILFRPSRAFLFYLTLPTVCAFGATLWATNIMLLRSNMCALCLSGRLMSSGASPMDFYLHERELGLQLSVAL